jgi:hypothetical protein
MTWPPQPPDHQPNCGNSFKTVGKAFIVKLVERMTRVRKAVKAKGGYIEATKIG